MEQLAVATESVRVALYLDPFRFDQVDYFPAGLSITEILDSYKLPHDKLQWRILINDQVVAKESWDAARTVDGDIVIIRLMQEFFIGPALLAMMAAMSSAIGAIGSSITAFAATGLGQGIMGILGSQLIGIVGKLIMGAIAPPPTPSAPKFQSDPKTYSISGTQNALAPFAKVPKAYGKRRPYPMLAARAYTEIIGHDQYLRMLFTNGYGPVEATEIKIGDTLLSDFDDVDVEIRAGYPDDPPITLFTNDIQEDSLNVLLAATNDWANRPTWRKQTTAIGADEISIDISCPKGLISYNATGDHVFMQITIQARYSKYGLNQWINLPNITLTGATAQIVRKTLRWTPTAIDPDKKYDVEVQAYSRQWASDAESWMFDCYWTALRTIRHTAPVVMENLSQVALRIRASNQLNGVIDQLSVVARAIIRDYDGVGSWEKRAGSWYYDYVKTISGADPVYDLDTGIVHTANGRSLKITTALAGDIVGVASAAIPCQEGDGFQVAGWYRSDGAHASGASFKVAWGETDDFVYADALSIDVVLNNVSVSATWAQATFKIKAPGDAKYFRLIVYHDAITGGPNIPIYWDDMAVLFLHHKQRNDDMIPNNSFEAVDADKQPSEWELDWELTGSGPITYKAVGSGQTAPHEGKYSLRINPTSAGDGAAVASASMVVIAGQQFEVYGWVKGSANYGSGARMMVSFGNTPSHSKAQELSHIDIYNGALTTKWKKCDANITVPVGATYMRVAVYNWQTGKNVFWDDLHCVAIGGAVTTVNTSLANPSFDYPGQFTDNPASIYRDILQGPANKRPVADSRINLTKLEQWHTDNAAAGRKFNGIFDKPGTVFDALRDVASFGRAAFFMDGDRYSVVQDKAQSTIVQHVSQRNSWDYKGHKTFDDMPHAFKVRWINPDADWQQDELLVYADGYNAGNATKFESLDLTQGCIDHNQAWRDGRYHLAVAKYRPEKHDFNMDWENIVVQRGDLIRFVHDVPAFGVGAGRIKIATQGVVDYYAAIMARSPNGYWRCDEATGALIDETANGNNSTSIGGWTTRNYTPGLLASDSNSCLRHIGTGPGPAASMHFAKTATIGVAPFTIVARVKFSSGFGLYQNIIYQTGGTTGSPGFALLRGNDSTHTRVDICTTTQAGQSHIWSNSNIYDGNAHTIAFGISGSTAYWSLDGGNWESWGFNGSAPIPSVDLIFNTYRDADATFYWDDTAYFPSLLTNADLAAIHSIAANGPGASSLTAVTLDEAISFQAGTDYCVRFRKSDGSSLLANLVNPGTVETAVLTFVTPIAPADAPAVGDLAMVGVQGSESIQLVVSSIEYDRDFVGLLTCVNYDEAIYDADQGTPPNPASNLVPAIVVPAPTIVDIRSDETALVREANGTLQSRILIGLGQTSATLTQNLKGVQTRFREYSEDNPDGPWVVGSARVVDSGSVSIMPVRDRVSYDIMLRYEMLDGSVGKWTTVLGHTVIGKSNPPPDITDFAYAKLANGTLELSWTPVNALDLDHYEIREGTSWALGTLVATTVGRRYEVSAPTVGSHTYWIKAVDTSGNEATTADSVAVTWSAADGTSKIVTSITDIIEPIVFGIGTQQGASWQANYNATLGYEIIDSNAARQAVIGVLETGVYSQSLNGGYSLGYRVQNLPWAKTTASITPTGTLSRNRPWIGQTLAIAPAAGVVPSKIGSKSYAPITSQANAYTIYKPSQTVENHIMIVILEARDGSGTWTPPSGWTLARAQTVGGAQTHKQWLYWKKAGASEPSYYTFGYSLTDYLLGGMVVLKDAHGTNPINQSAGSSGTSTTPSCPAVTPNVANCMLIWAVSFFNDGTAGITAHTPPANKTGATEPTWNTNDGGYTQDNTLCWQKIASAEDPGIDYDTWSPVAVADITINDPDDLVHFLVQEAFSRSNASSQDYVATQIWDAPDWPDAGWEDTAVLVDSTMPLITEIVSPTYDWTLSDTPPLYNKKLSGFAAGAHHFVLEQMLHSEVTGAVQLKIMSGQIAVTDEIQ